MKAPKLKAPMPYFGGKSRVATLVWDRLGDVDNFIEPFSGSAAVLLGRPHAPRIETINDADTMVANFWRATSRDPEAVAEFADWPVNEADLHARHRWLVLSKEAAAFRQRMRTDPEYFSPSIAGWWVWGSCCWIGGGWCSTNRDGDVSETMPTAEKCQTGGKGVNGVRQGDGKGGPPGGTGDRSIKLGGGHGQYGNGVHSKGPENEPGPVPGLHAKRPAISGDNPGSSGHGVHSGQLMKGNAKPPHEWQQKPNLRGDSGAAGNGVHVSGNKGVHSGRPQLGDAFSRGRGIHGNDSAGTCAQRRAWLLDWFGRLRDRLRTVRVCCGDWLRVCDSESVTTRLGVTGVFLDPPYALHLERLAQWIRFLQGKRKTPPAGKRKETSRDGNLYATDGGDVDHIVARVHVYCLERGADPRMRLALCGYEGDNNALERAGWDVVAWAAQGGYGNRSSKGKDNAKRERIWFSPGCRQERGLFS